MEFITDIRANREYLRSLNLLERGKWQREYFPILYEAICDRLHKILPEIIASYDPSQKHYCAEDIYKQAVRYSEGELSSKSRFFPLLSFTALSSAELPEISCQKILFEDDRKIEIYGRDKAFLQYWEATDEDVRSEALKILISNPESVDNPMYILQKRTADYAYSEGLGVSTWVLPFFSRANRPDANDKLLSSDVSPVLDPSDRTRYALNRSLLWYMIGLYISTEISADYMLMQDYSPYALYNGQPLPDFLKDPFTAYLCATSDAQCRALEYIHFSKL